MVGNEELAGYQDAPCSSPDGIRTTSKHGGFSRCRRSQLKVFCGMKFDYNRYSERRREVCGGELVVQGTRVTVRTLLASLAEGASPEEIRADFPTITAEALRSVVAFAAASAEEDVPVPPMPAVA